ncbi:NAD(P)H-dependent oxidoreductase [Aquibacillus sp. 3ASR75-11]|uniref:NAD(P)H-dependent oxidoreductase n=1 Tax=Terrihalobacillus insolitus TaxID=2950438 RepID=A0A9X4AN22_9BACI|nr:NAD(P)H-dependent oxidoreductase [Terrihalobacillus insolitus]MDC3424088.1 NAD(P)H-dependent oxidoreductase [Terrihalobacillus insolitus]
MKLLGLSGSLVGWKTNVAVHNVLTAAKDLDSNIETELLDLRDYEVEFMNGDPLAYYNEDTWNVVNKVTSADLLVIGTPIFQASISGALKNLFDHLPVDAFKGKVTGMVTNGAIDKHFLVSEYQLKPILTYLKALVPTTSIFIHEDAFNDVNEIIDKEVSMRIKMLSEEMLFLQKCLDSK